MEFNPTFVSCGYQNFKMVPTEGQSFSIGPYGKRNRLFFSEAMNLLHPNYNQNQMIHKFFEGQI